jgi:DNA (cytosine-5)-methyltransferase 1
VLVGFRRDLQLHEGFTLRDIAALYPTRRPTFGELLEPRLTTNLFSPGCCGSISIAMRKHQERGNGLATASSTQRIRTAWRERSARYYKDGAEILIDRAGIGLWAKSILMT